MMYRVRRLLLPTSAFRIFVIILGVCYLCMVFSFHSSLQPGPSELGHHHKPHVRKKLDPQVLRDEIQSRDMKPIVEADFKKFVAPKKKEEKKEKKKEKVSVAEKPVEDVEEFEGLEPVRPLGEKCEGNETKEFVFHTFGKGMFVFSAYWDDRPNDFDNLLNKTIVRFIAVARRGTKPAISCKFLTGNDPVEYSLSDIRYYEMCENHGRAWGGYILSCAAPDSVQTMPCQVNLVGTDSTWFGNPPSVNITVHSLLPSDTQHAFSTCVPPLFGNIDPIKLTEFIEISRLMGAEHFTFYDIDVSENVKKLLTYYQKMGIVSIVPWVLPKIIGNAIWYHGQILAIQDCLYRNMHSSVFLSFNDIDEILVPHGDGLEHWSDILSKLDQPSRAAFQFQSAFFDIALTDHTETDPRFSNMTMLVANRRTEHFSHIRTKCMVKPRLVFEKGIHHVSKPIWAGLEVLQIRDQRGIAFLHHYRKCMPNFGMNCAAYVNDSSLLRYSESVFKNINHSLNSVNLPIS